MRPPTERDLFCLFERAVEDAQAVLAEHGDVELAARRSDGVWEVTGLRFALDMAPVVGAPIHPVADLHRAVSTSDIVVTCTTSKRPILGPDDVRPGTFVAAVGADNPEKHEIDPRLLTGKVRKSDPAERRKLLAECYPRLQPEHVRLAVASEDAFDATVSALVMIEHIDDLRALPEEHDPELCLEGRIWHPGWRLDNP